MKHAVSISSALMTLLLAVAGCAPAGRRSGATLPLAAPASAQEVAPEKRTTTVDAPGDSTLAPEESPRVPLKLPLVNPKIVVQKSRRRLSLYAGERLLRTYRVGLGFSPVADKTRAGDGATPEGSFYVFTKNEHSAYYLSLGVSYPNEEDAERGLRDGLITKNQYRQIMRALRTKSTPPQYTALGGLIYIHGNGSSRDWTWGCVALEDADMRELFDAVPKGTPVVIEP